MADEGEGSRDVFGDGVEVEFGVGGVEARHEQAVDGGLGDGVGEFFVLHVAVDLFAQFGVEVLEFAFVLADDVFDAFAEVDATDGKGFRQFLGGGDGGAFVLQEGLQELVEVGAGAGG